MGLANYKKHEPELKECKKSLLGRNLQSFPYLPLSNYDISKDIVNLLPNQIAEKYYIMPVDKVGNILSIVMENPFDDEAVSEAEKFTSCVIRRFLGTHNEIASAIKYYYQNDISRVCDKKKPKTEPQAYKINFEKPSSSDPHISKWDGKSERRSSFRFKCSINLNVMCSASMGKTETVDISYDGMCFRSEQDMPVGACLCLSINIPDDNKPIMTLIKVLRVKKVGVNNFQVSGKILKPAHEDINKIIKYAAKNKPAEDNTYDDIEKRKFKRIRTKLDILYPEKGIFEKTVTEDISYDGISFKSKINIPVGSYIPFQLDLAEEQAAQTVIMLGQVARVILIGNGQFLIGVKRIIISEEDMESLVKYASKHKNN